MRLSEHIVEHPPWNPIRAVCVKVIGGELVDELRAMLADALRARGNKDTLDVRVRILHDTRTLLAWLDENRLASLLESSKVGPLGRVIITTFSRLGEERQVRRNERDIGQTS